MNLSIPGGLALVLFATMAPGVDPIEEARANGLFAREAFRHCERYLSAWMSQVDPSTGLIPRNLGKDRDLWVPKDNAADNFPFLLLSAAILNRPLFEQRMIPMLATERRLTARIATLPDTWSFSRQGFLSAEPNPDAILFGATEYAHDGLLAITEFLGPGPWSERMDELARDILGQARFETPTCLLPLDSYEVNGELLQVLCRAYWRTGDKALLDAALCIGDHYLLGDALPTRGQRRLRMRDRGAEIIAGLSELYVTVASANPQRRDLYRPALHEMINRVLEVGRNDDGLFFAEFDPSGGGHVDGLANSFGNVLSGILAVYTVDGILPYRAAALEVLNALPAGYQNYAWEGDNAAGLAGALEGALGLLNHEPSPPCATWLESEARVLWSKQQPDGTIEGDHRDGAFARTTLKLALWKTAGLRLDPWREDLIVGAVRNGEELVCILRADRAWSGRLVFDVPRHRLYSGLPSDYPRANAFPEWFTVEESESYSLSWTGSEEQLSAQGAQLAQGLPLELTANEELHLVVLPSTPR